MRPSRGCGGNGLWADEKLWLSKNFVASRVLANGPIRVLFELTYDAFDEQRATRHGGRGIPGGRDAAVRADGCSHGYSVTSHVKWARGPFGPD